jgi:hypothetical protein
MQDILYFYFTNGLKGFLTLNEGVFTSEFLERNVLDKMKKSLMLTEYEDDICFIHVKLS